MAIYVDNQHDYRLHKHHTTASKTIINLEYMYSNDGLRFFQKQADIELNNEEWAFMQEQFGLKLQELDNGDLLG